MNNLKILRDLLKTNKEFAFGFGLTAFVFVIAMLSFVSPYSPIDVYVVARWAVPGGGDLWGGEQRRAEGGARPRALRSSDPPGLFERNDRRE